MKLSIQNIGEKRSKFLELVKYISAKTKHQNVINTKNRIGRFVLLDNDNTLLVPKTKILEEKKIRKQADLARLNEGEFRKLKFSSFLGVHEKGLISEELDLKAKEQLCSQVGEYFASKKDVIWTIGTREQVREAYRTIRSCMSERLDDLDYYFKLPKLFFFLIAIKNSKPIARCLFVQDKENNCIPVRLYSSTPLSGLGFTDGRDSFTRLDAILNNFGKKLQTPLNLKTSTNLFGISTYSNFDFKDDLPNIGMYYEDRKGRRLNYPYSDYPRTIFCLATREKYYTFVVCDKYKSTKRINSTTIPLIIEDVIVKHDLHKKYGIPLLGKNTIDLYQHIWNKVGLLNGSVLTLPKYFRDSETENAFFDHLNAVFHSTVCEFLGVE